MGELMLRLIAVGDERISRGLFFQKEAGCAELNVAAAASLLGLRTALISKLPETDLGLYIRNSVRSFGVDDRYLLPDRRKEARIGVYYCERGAYPRKPKVLYDRGASSIHSLKVKEVPEEVFSETNCFHTSGIILALSEELRETAIELMKKFKENGVRISFDVNYRANLWSGEEAALCIKEILPYVDYLFCSVDTAQLTFGKTGSREEILKSFVKEYPLLKAVVATQRTVHSPRLHTFSSLIYAKEEDRFYEEEPYRNIEIVDRIGSGDAYVAGVLYGLLTKEKDYMRAVRYGNALCALKCTVPRDIAVTSRAEIDAMIKAHGCGGYQTELSR